MVKKTHMKMIIDGTQKNGSFSTALNILLTLVVLLIILSAVLMKGVMHANLQSEKRIAVCQSAVDKARQLPASTAIEKSSAEAALGATVSLCSQIIE